MVMKMTVLLETKKGFFGSASANVRNVKEGLDKVMPTLDKLPDEVDGVSSADWTKISISFER